MTTLFALPAENNFGDTVPNGVAGPMGLFITILLVIATVLLIRNMNSRLRRLPQSFPGQTAEPESKGEPTPADEPPAPGSEEQAPRT
jgi:hypothetical protein